MSERIVPEQQEVRYSTFFEELDTKEKIVGLGEDFSPFEDGIVDAYDNPEEILESPSFRLQELGIAGITLSSVLDIYTPPPDMRVVRKEDKDFIIDSFPSPQQNLFEFDATLEPSKRSIDMDDIRCVLTLGEIQMISDSPTVSLAHILWFDKWKEPGSSPEDDGVKLNFPIEMPLLQAAKIRFEQTSGDTSLD